MVSICTRPPRSSRSFSRACCEQPPLDRGRTLDPWSVLRRRVDVTTATTTPRPRAPDRGTSSSGGWVDPRDRCEDPLMLEALGVREANAPLAGRRMLSASLVSVGIVRQARPRSAVTVSPTAPGLAPLTGFSRSGTRRRSIRRSEVLPNRRYGRETCRGLEALCYALCAKPLHSAPRRPSSPYLGGGGHFMSRRPRGL